MNFVKSMLRSSQERSRKGTEGNLDFDEEARALWARLNMDPVRSRSGSVWNPADPIWRHPTGNGLILVGNQTAAENLNYLRYFFFLLEGGAHLSFFRKENITHIVNCTYGFSKIPNFHEGKLKYYNFPVLSRIPFIVTIFNQISHWTTFVNGTDDSVIGTLNELSYTAFSMEVLTFSFVPHSLSFPRRFLEASF
jgi:hypothetical protein